MELEKLISTAKEKLGETNASDRTIENFFANTMFCPTEGTEPDEAYWNRTLATFKWYSDNYGGQHNHEMSTARAAWEEEWKKNHPSPEPQKPEPQKPEPPKQLTAEDIQKIIQDAIKANSKGNEPDPVIAALQKQMKEMQDAKEKEASERAVNGIYDSVQKKIMDESYGEASQVILEDVIERLRLENAITKDTNVSDAEKMIRERYEKQYKRYNPGGNAPYGIAASVSGSGDKTYAQRWLDKKNESSKSRESIVEGQRKRFK